MILINFGHPLTQENLRELEALLGAPVERVIECPAQFDPAEPFAPQVVDLVDRAGLTPRQWQGEPILINPPTLNAIVALLLAELHGRMGYFPPILRLRSKANCLPPRFEVAEILDLAAQRDAARQRR